MIIVGLEIATELIKRELRLRPRQGRTLKKRIAAWKQEVEAAQWRRPTDIKAVYGTADIVGDSRIVFDICGNTYRLIVKFNYAAQVARIRFAGTHEEYDRIDVTEV